MAASASRKATAMRPPALPRPGIIRAATATPTLNGRTTPSDSMAARQRSPKRKAQSDITEQPSAEETNINVVVRCRGRNDREVKENSAVVVSSDGIKGSKVELSMGPNALSNKAYQFDKVFSPAADQEMIYDEVVAPILEEVLAGFNCTIFAYGQTGTGKTFTMSGDIADVLPIPEAAGIIPRVLHDLFEKLDANENNKLETSVKCSFIELYNEELRDLLAVDDSVKLKIFDDANKNGRTTTMIQGMEETYIESAFKGIRLLSEGSLKRQVAATKCNDLSSRSHTVFTMTIYHKRVSATGEENISASKLNLVDLAGSENIGRSGAENKRATEAGLINKSLLTLGRVINALVDRSAHIPYRESKLTRLLQDSLGGRTKTCIIATLSPAKSNLEETISTLDYAFRAKNIRNKPQMNQLVSKKTLLREFTSEIEKLKSELIATRHRNGYYLTAEAYEELTTQSESRRILSEEQKDKIETMESNLRNKVQELFNLTTNFQSMKKDNEKIKGRLDSTRDLLDNTELVLGHAKRSLAEETYLRKAYAETEAKLSATAQGLQSALETSTKHVALLHDKIDRTAEVHDTNEEKWQSTKSCIVDTALLLEEKLDALHSQQQDTIEGLTARISDFVSAELRAAQLSQQATKEYDTQLCGIQSQLQEQSAIAQNSLGSVLDGVSTVRDNTKAKLVFGLDALEHTAQRISEGVSRELLTLQNTMKSSWTSFRDELQHTLDGYNLILQTQYDSLTELHNDKRAAEEALLEARRSNEQHLSLVYHKECQDAEVDRQNLMADIQLLISEATRKRDRRWEEHIEQANKRIKMSDDTFESSAKQHHTRMEQALQSTAVDILQRDKDKETLVGRVDGILGLANQGLAKIAATVHAVNGETVQAIEAQKSEIDGQLVCLNSIVSGLQNHHDQQTSAHASTVALMGSVAKQSQQHIGAHHVESENRLLAMQRQYLQQTSILQTSAQELIEGSDIRSTVGILRDDLGHITFSTYQPTGTTPARTQYARPAPLPCTQPRDVIIDALRGPSSLIEQISPSKTPAKRSPRKRLLSPTKIPTSPSKTQVFNDLTKSINLLPQLVLPKATELHDITEAATLREMDTNIPPYINEASTEVSETLAETPPILVPARQPVRADKQSKKTTRFVSANDGRENVAPHRDEKLTRNAPARRSLRNRNVD